MFDAYHKWLGIPPAEQPPNHYRLLGIALFEDDPVVVENAADQRLGHLRCFQTSQQNALAEQLLNEVTSAKLCLLRPERKAKYDAGLTATLRPEVLPVAAAYVQPAPAVVVSPAFVPTEMVAVPAPAVQPQVVVVPSPPAPVPLFAVPPPAPAVSILPAAHAGPRFAQAAALAPTHDYSRVFGEPTATRPSPTSSSSKQFRRAKPAFPWLVVIGPIVGIAAVAGALIALNANNDDDSSTKIQSPRQASIEPRSQPTAIQKPLRPNPKPVGQPPDPFAHFSAQQTYPYPDSTPNSTPSTSPDSNPNVFQVSKSFGPLLSPITTDTAGFLAMVVSLPESRPDFSKVIDKTDEPISLTFEQKVERIGGRDIPNDEQSVTVPIGIVLGGAELRIAAHIPKEDRAVKISLQLQTDTVDQTKVVLQEQPEPITVRLSVTKGKPGFATIRIKPWLGPESGALGIPCSLPRLNGLLAALPNMIADDQNAINNAQQQIQSLQSQLQNLNSQYQSASLVQKAPLQTAMHSAQNSLNHWSSVLRTNSKMLSRDQGRLAELPDLIKQVESLVGRKIEFRISYTVLHRDLVVAHSGDQIGATDYPDR